MLRDNRVRKGDYLAENGTPLYLAYVLRAAIAYDVAELAGDTGAGGKYDEIINAYNTFQIGMADMLKALKVAEDMEIAAGLEPAMQLDRLLKKAGIDYLEDKQ